MMKKNLTSGFSIKLILLGISLIIFSTITDTYGEPLAAESFNTYDLGELDGLNNGQGWSNAWITSSVDREDVISPPNPLAKTTEVVFDGSSRALKINGDDPNNNIVIRRALSTPFTGDVLYVRYLFRTTEIIDVNDFVTFWLDDEDDDGVLHTDGSAYLGVSGADGGTAFARLIIENGNWDHVNGSRIYRLGDYLIVAKLYKDNSSDYNRMTFWVNPTREDILNGVNPDGAATNNISLSSISHVGIRTGSHTETNDLYVFDELCLATNAADIMPGPFAGDTFDLPLGEINGQSGGYGFGDDHPWIIKSGTAGNSEIVEPTVPLSFTNSAGSVNGGDRALELSGGGVTANFAVRQFDQAQSNKLFFCFLAQYNGQDSNDFFAFWLDDNGNTDFNHNENVPNIGLRQGGLYMRMNIGDEQTLLANVNDGQTVCLLGLLQKTDGSTTYNSFKAWVDPGPQIDTDMPDATAALVAGSGLTNATHIGVRMGTFSDNSDKLLLDRLAFGPTVNSVLPISEKTPDPPQGTVILVN